MAEMPKILLIVEGPGENDFFRRYLEHFRVNAEIVTYKTNIYKLYERLKEDDFDTTICGLLEEADPDNPVLHQKFIATYLIYDADFQHCDKGENRLDIHARMDKNLPRLREMAAYFNEETDDSRGKLFVNYPMMESYRDCDSFFEAAYANRFVVFKELMKSNGYYGYKSLVARRKVSGRTVDQLTTKDMVDIVRCAACKLSFLAGKDWKFPDYVLFREAIDPQTLLSYEERFFAEERLSVINSSVLLVLDYKGNKDSFYDSMQADCLK